MKVVIEPLFEGSFRPGSYGFRPKRSAKQAIYDMTYGYDKVIDLDLKSYFDTPFRATLAPDVIGKVSTLEPSAESGGSLPSTGTSKRQTLGFCGDFLQQLALRFRQRSGYSSTRFEEDSPCT